MANLSPVDFCGILVVILAVLALICQPLAAWLGIAAIFIALLGIVFTFMEKDAEQ
jgi:hypothetical protein